MGALTTQTPCRRAWQTSNTESRFHYSQGTIESPQIAQRYCASRINRRPASKILVFY